MGQFVRRKGWMCTFCNRFFSQADGHYQDQINKVEGAPMSMIIHNLKKTNKDKKGQGSTH